MSEATAAGAARVADAALELDVLLFASAADALGRSSLLLRLRPGSTVADVRAAVLAAAAGAAGHGRPPMPTTFRLAVNQAFADEDRELAAGDEIAVIPPVAGG